MDPIACAGITFRYTANGPEGLVTGKKVYVAVSSGSIYSGGPSAAYDFVGPCLRAVLGSLGMTDVTVVRAEGLALPGLQAKSVQAALNGLLVAAPEPVLA